MQPTTALLSFTLAIAASACHGGKDSPHGSHRTAAATTTISIDPVMTEAAIAMPIAPGKTEAWTAALEELTSPRYDEYDTSRRRFGLTAQTTFLQKTPMGDLALIHMTGADVHDSLHRMSSSQDAWDVQWRELTKDLHGVDFGDGEEVLPHVEAAYSMDTGVSAGSQEFLFAAPLTKSGVDDLRAMTKQLMGERHDEYVRARHDIGVEREAAFLETTAMGDVAVFYRRAPDPQASLRRLVHSTEPFDTWLREQATKAHPVSLDMLIEIASTNTMVGQYPHQ